MYTTAALHKEEIVEGQQLAAKPSANGFHAATYTH
jgi:hypothetical protein